MLSPGAKHLRGRMRGGRGIGGFRRGIGAVGELLGGNGQFPCEDSTLLFPDGNRIASIEVEIIGDYPTVD